MFKSARTKLTIFYIAIIMAITGTFSIIVYEGISSAAEQALLQHQARIENRLRELGPFGNPPPARFQEPITEEAVATIKQKLATILLVVEGGILLISGALAYVFAGKTLKPIEEMVNKQKKFIGDAAHELKTPLTSLKTSVEVATRDKKLTKTEAINTLNETLEDIDKLNDLINRLLKQSTYEAYSRTEFEKINIDTAITDAVSNLKGKTKAKEINILADKTNSYIKGNQKSLTEVFTILLDNSIKYSKPKSEVIIKIIEHKRHIDIKIIDSGYGIAKEDLPYIFDRFYKADKSRNKSKEDGYGLGLSIAKEIINMHKGEIQAQSEINKGTTISIKLFNNF